MQDIWLTEIISIDLSKQEWKKSIHRKKQAENVRKKDRLKKERKNTKSQREEKNEVYKVIVSEEKEQKKEWKIKREWEKERKCYSLFIHSLSLSLVIWVASSKCFELP